MSRRRLDHELVVRGLAKDDDDAARLIHEQRVLIDGAPAAKVSTMVGRQSDLRLAESKRFASRGGLKLEGCLDDLAIDPRGLKCLDAGAGSGGFTDCLLSRGATEVVAVDVGYGQFDWRLRSDPRVRLFERTNIRTVEVGVLGGPFDLVVADLSFISLEAVLDRLLEAASPSGGLLILVKPQFEALPIDVPAGGVVRDPEVHRRSVEKITSALIARGWGVAGVVASQVPGADGNREFFVHSKKGVS